MSEGRVVVEPQDIRVVSSWNTQEEFARAIATFGHPSRQQTMRVQAHGANHQRAAAFALRKLADWLLEEYPR